MCVCVRVLVAVDARALSGVARWRPAAVAAVERLARPLDVPSAACIASTLGFLLLLLLLHHHL
jgi:hypothetical protein